MDELTEVEELQAAALEILKEGAVSLPDLVKRLDEQGQLDWLREDGVPEDELPEAVEDYVLATDALWGGPDERIVLSAQLTDGMVLTHRLSAQEIELEAVLSSPDLVILDWDVEDDLMLGSGEPLLDLPGPRVPGEDLRAFVGPEGWLSQFSPGDVMAFVRSGDAVRVEAVGGLGEGELEVDLLRRAAERIPAGAGEEPLPILLDALTLDPSAFRRPVRPLGELLVAAGLEQRGFSFGRAGEEWLSAGEEWRASCRVRVLERWDISGCCEEAFDAALASFERYQETGEEPARSVTHHLAHGVAAPAFAEYVMESRPGLDGQLGEFASFLASGGTKRAAPAQLILAMDAESQGDLVTAEAMLRAARRGDPDYGPAAVHLADYEIDRGNLDAAIVLLRHPDLPEGQPALEFLEEYRASRSEPFRGIGRNDPCPCGSGRKFKGCCQNSVSAPLSARVGLLMFKLSRYVTGYEQRATLVAVAGAAVNPESPRHMDALVEKMRDPLVVDFARWEGGLAEEFLDERGSLLPDDERELVAALLEQPRRLWELTAVEAGRALTLRDTATGDVVRVDEKLGSVGRSVGEYLLARVAALDGVGGVAGVAGVAGGDAAQIVGAVMAVPLRLRESALALVDSDPDAIDLATWYGLALAPPRLANREGDPMILCRVDLSTGVSDAAVEAALNEVPVLEGHGGGEWAELWELPGGERILRGTVRLDDGTLCIETNSRERSERLVDLVLGLFPDAEVEDESYTDPRTEMADSSEVAGDPLGGPGLPIMDHRMQEILDQMMREKEMEWVEESIPALGGLTPRQALDDPTRREDLLALLREFEGYEIPEGAGGFNVGRIRGLLGLA
jgi:hypothetical protein